MEAASAVGTAERVVQHVLEHARCPRCGASYRLEDVHVLGQFGDRIWDLAAVCPECYELGLSRAVVEWVEEAPPSVPDLDPVPSPWPSLLDERSAAERVRLERLEPIAASDVADAAAFLERFDGDPRDWLARTGHDPGLDPEPEA